MSAAVISQHHLLNVRAIQKAHNTDNATTSRIWSDDKLSEAYTQQTTSSLSKRNNKACD